IRAGGKHGKHPLFGYEVAQYVPDEGIYALMEKTLEWYQKTGQGRERIGATIGRVGLNKYVDEVVRPLGLEAIDKPEDRRKYRSGGNFYE
ncbi:MAG: hypothetical protein Q7O66_22895, partial [Dehalococcoidia bacterium]|nr:hypothetical protein [Dehalococcoidia bacterium]